MSDLIDVFQVEAAYDMLLMQSLTQRRAGKVVNSGIRYADVKPVNASGLGSMPQWLQTTVKNSPVSVETPSTVNLGIQAGVYGALIGLTYINGASTSSAIPFAGADVPGLILATSFGASLYFMTKKNVKLGKLPFFFLDSPFSSCKFWGGEGGISVKWGLSLPLTLFLARLFSKSFVCDGDALDNLRRII